MKLRNFFRCYPYYYDQIETDSASTLRDQNKAHQILSYVGLHVASQLMPYRVHLTHELVPSLPRKVPNDLHHHSFLP